MSDVCPDCERDQGVYWFDRNCCVARFLVSVPGKALRNLHLSGLEKKYGAERMAIVKIKVEKLWAAKRQKVFERKI